MKQEIKYKYAYNNKELVFIGDLERSKINKSDKFYCISCNNELIPKLGKIKQKHFAHKKNTECSSETYLHKLGKEIFYKEYKSCLDEKIPFTLEFYEFKICNKKEDELGVTCNLGKEYIKLDLTKYFNDIKLEEKTGNFIPDVLLFNNGNENKLFFEIAVTHKLSEEKKNSRFKIIELEAKTDKDFDIIKKHSISIKDERIKLTNFVAKERKKNYCKDNCLKEYDLFIVTKKGKSIMLNNKNLDEISSELKKAPHAKEYTEISESQNRYSRYRYLKYKYFVAQTFLKNIPIKNCFICKYQAINEYYSDFSDAPPIFCKFLKKGTRSNEAADCKYFRGHKEYVDNIINEWDILQKSMEENDMNKTKQKT